MTEDTNIDSVKNFFSPQSLGRETIDFSGFSKEVGRLAEPPKEGSVLSPHANSLLVFFHEVLLKNEGETQKECQSESTNSLVSCVLAITGMGIVAASQIDSQAQELALRIGLLRVLISGKSLPDVPDFESLINLLERDETLIRQLYESDDAIYSPISRRLSLNDLTFAEQYIEKEVRDSLYDIIEILCFVDPWSPGIRDYITLSRQRLMSKEPSPNLSDPVFDNDFSQLDVVALCSMKGGVGKSSAALSLFAQATELGHKSLLIDFDFTGPTLQYYLNVREVKEDTQLIPYAPSYETRQWVYPTFMDLLAVRPHEHLDEENYQTLAEKHEIPETRRARADWNELSDREKWLMTTSTRDQVAQSVMLAPDKEFGESGRVVLLPDSPEYAIATERITASSEQESSTFRALSSLFRVAKQEGRTTIIIDFGPGLITANHKLLAWLGQNTKMRLLLFSSLRASDIATGVYEGTWAAAAGEISNVSPLVHVVNMRGSGGEDEMKVGDQMKLWINNTLTLGLRSIVQGKGIDNYFRDKMYSSEHVFYWRLWAGLYWSGVPSRSNNDLRLESLPFQEDLRTALHPSKNEHPFRTSWKKVVKSDWSKRLLEIVSRNTKLFESNP